MRENERSLTWRKEIKERGVAGGGKRFPKKILASSVKTLVTGFCKGNRRELGDLAKVGGSSFPSRCGYSRKGN